METLTIDLKKKKSFEIGQQGDHNALCIHFINMKNVGTNKKYIYYTIDGIENCVPLTNDRFIIGYPLTAHSGIASAQLISKLNDNSIIKLSNVFAMHIKESKGYKDSGEYPVDPNIQSSYDLLDDLIDQTQDLINNYNYATLMEKLTQASSEATISATTAKECADELKNSTDFINTLDEKVAAQDSKIEKIEASTSHITTKQNTKIAALQTRMSEFTSLKDGSTTGDAELIDARIGADGTKYPSAGDAMRGQVEQLNEVLVDYANSGLVSIAQVETLLNAEINSFAVNLKANTMYLLDTVFNGSGQYSISFYDSSDIRIETILNLSSSTEKKIFYLKKDATKMNVYRNNTSDSLTFNVFTYDTSLYDLQSVVEPVILNDYVKQYAEDVDYIVDVKKGEIVTVTVDVDRLANTTVTLFNTDIYSNSETTNLVLWNDIPQINKSYTLIADKDYKFIRVHKSVGVLNLKVEKEKQYKDNQVKLNFVNGSYYPQGQLAQSYSNRVAPQTLGGNGLFLISFPDTMICHYYVGEGGIDTETPFAIYGDHGLYIHFKSKDETKPISSASDLSGIKIWYIDKPHDNDDIVVSASDSKDSYKQISDIVCDGTNDTDVLSALVGSFNSINIKLMDGTYNINKAWKTSNNAKVSLSLNENLLGYDGSSRRRYITMCGKHKTSPQDFEGVKLVVSEELHNSFDDSTNNIILGAGYDKTKEVGRIACSVNFENFNIIGFKYDKPITYIDTTRCLSTMIDSVNIRSWKANLLKYDAFENTPNAECCGIRVGRGSNYGIQNYVKHSNIWYCGKGLACNGEHFIFEDVKLHHDYNAIVLGDRKTVGRFEHPNIFMGCSIEACYRLGLLSKNGITEPQDFVADYANRLQSSTLIMIGTSTETTWNIPTNEIVGDKTVEGTLPFKEILRGCYRGRVEIDWWQSPFAEDGSGKRMNYTSYDGNLNTYRNDAK